MAAIFGKRKFFWKLPRVPWLDSLWVENFDKIALSHMVKAIEANLCFTIFGKKIWKFKMAAIFGEMKFFLEIVKSTFLRYPVSRNFQRTHSISHG